jgi:hypothetical protein
VSTESLVVDTPQDYQNLSSCAIFMGAKKRCLAIETKLGYRRSETQGIDDALIQPYSGHATRQSLEIYSRIALADAQQAYDQAIGRYPVSPLQAERVHDPARLPR